METKGNLIMRFDVSGWNKLPKYDTIEVYQDRVVAYEDAKTMRICHFQDYVGLKLIEPSFSTSGYFQIVFLDGKKRVDVSGLGITFDRNRILLATGVCTYGKTKDAAYPIADCIREAFNAYQSKADQQSEEELPLEELKKYKALLDEGLISEEDYNALKRKVLGL